MDGTSSEKVSFGRRWTLAWQVLTDGGFARKVVSSLAGGASAAPALPKPEARPGADALKAGAAGVGGARAEVSGLALLAALQREGRLVDFLQQDVTGFSDEDVAAAARVVHSGCRRVLKQTVDLEPAVRESEGATLLVPAGFDAQRIRLAGNVVGQPPYRGTVRHAGWFAREVRFPTVSEAVDPRVIAAAEVELP